MMTVTLYKNVSDKRVLNKNITEIKSVNAFLYEPCDIDNPIFKLSYDNDILSCNYLSAFGNYYFCELEFQQGGIVLLKCQKDVLMSNADDIKNIVGTVVRQEHVGMTTIPDTNILIQNNYSLECYRFQDAPFIPSQQSTFVLQVVGGK